MEVADDLAQQLGAHHGEGLRRGFVALLTVFGFLREELLRFLVGELAQELLGLNPGTFVLGMAALRRRSLSQGSSPRKRIHASKVAPPQVSSDQ